MMMGAKANAMRQGLRARLAAMSHNGRFLLLFAMINGITLMSVGALINPYLREIGLSSAFIGTYFAVSAIAQALASFGGGFVADLFGRRRVWIIGKGLQAASYLVLASGVREPWIMVAPVLAGLSQIGAGSYQALTAEATADGQRATFFSVMRTIESLVGVLAPLAGGFIADAFGPRTAFIVAMPLFAAVALVISKLHESRDFAQPAAPSPNERRSSLATGLTGLRRRLYDGVMRGPHPKTAVGLMGHQLINGFSNGVIMLALPLILKDRFNLGYAGISGAQTAISLGTAAMVIIGGRMADRRGRRSVILASSLSFSLFFLLFPFATVVWQFYALLFVICLLGNAAGGAFGATQMECIRADVRATFGGVCQALNAAGMAVGSITGGLLYALQPNLPITTAMVSNLVGVVVLWLLLEETGVRPQPRLVPSVGENEPSQEVAS